MRVINATVLIVLFGLAILGCKSIVNALAFYPDSADVIPLANLPYEVKELVVTTSDNVELTSLYLPSTQSNKLLIYFHGNAGNIYHRMPGLLKLHGFGLNVIGVSYRGYGKSGGSPSEAGVYRDGEAIFHYATDVLGFSEENIILFGRSIGTAVAINTAQNKQIRGLILVSPLTSGKEQAKAGGLGLVASLAGDAFDNITKIDKVQSPLLVIHGTHDQVIPYWMGKAIFDRAKVRKSFVGIEGADHNNLHAEYDQKYWRPILNFIEN